MAARLTLFALALWLALVDFYSNFANANLTVRPTNTVVLVNHLTYFNCSTSSRNINVKSVLWYHYPVNSPTRNDVYDEGVIMFEYKDRFRIETNLAEGVFNLVAERPSLADAGRYECQDGVGQGDKASAELIVLGDGNPNCESNMTSDGVIGPNDCGLEPNDIQLTCNVASYHGNIPPTLEWKVAGDESSSSMVVCENSTSCIRTLKSNLTLNSQSLVCQTTKARGQQYGCSIGPVKVKYALRSRVTTITAKIDVLCSVNTNQPCTYRWYNDKDEEVSVDEDLGVQSPGDYKCEAECEMKVNESCRFMATEVHVKRQDLSVVFAVVGVVTSLFLVTSLIVICCILKKRVTTTSLGQNQVKQPVEPLLSLEERPDAHMNSSEESQVKQQHKQALLLKEKSSQIFEKPDDAVDNPLKLPSSLPIIKDQDMVDKLTINQHFIDRGTSGAIYGPFKWKDKKCGLKQILYSPDKLTEERKEEITQLRNCCRDLDHPHLVKVFEVWFPSPALYVLMEYAEGKSLDKILRPKNASSPLPPISLGIVENWALQIADGMKYLHGKKLVHRNLKAAHVLVMESADVLPNTLKIGSYTLAREHDHSTVMSLKGTMAWMAPEYIRGEPFSMLSDVWSYGVTVWEILTRDVPYKEIRKETELVRAAMNKTLKLTIPESCPEPLRTLLTECWNYEVNERPSFTGICDCLNKIADYVEESCVQ